MLTSSLNLNLLVVAILIICIWFFLVNDNSKDSCRMTFIDFMCFAVLMYINRIVGITIEHGYINANDTLIVTQEILQFIFPGVLYTFYAFFMGKLLHEFEHWKKWLKTIFILPMIIYIILVITTPWTGLMFTYNKGVFETGSLFWAMFGIRTMYGVVGTILALSKRKMLPGIFSKCVYCVTICSIVEIVYYVITLDEMIFYSTSATNIIVLAFALTVLDLFKDSETGLLNEEAFEQLINYEIKGNKNAVVYLVKLKNYSYLKVNSSAGALSGAVKEISEILLDYSNVPSAYYIGEGRYVLVVTKNKKFNEKSFLERLEKRFKNSFNVNGASITLSLFIAVINLSDDRINNTNFWKYFDACDSLQYKDSKSVEIIYGDNYGVDHLQRYKEVEEAIERALIEKEFQMYYQPIVSAKTQKVTSCEALIRLNDRITGFISPEEFIPISEANGTILEISDYVIESVFRFIAENDIESLGLEYVEMNLSMIQCMDENLPDKLLYFAEKYNINPKQVNLEITETATSLDENSLKKQLQKIKDHGFTFSLDDFGTGYSNLVRVLEFPVDIIKMDKAVVWSAFHNSDNYAALKNLIVMFHDVRRELVAEGVESEEQKLKLTELGCDYLQGYFYSKPVPEKEFIKYISKFNGRN